MRGHVYYSNSEWGLSAINQSGFWMDKPNLNTRRYVSVMSVDIGDWNTPSCEEKPARECTREEIALEVWRQITVELLDTFGYDVVARQLPLPLNRARPSWRRLLTHTHNRRGRHHVPGWDR